MLSKQQKKYLQQSIKDEYNGFIFAKKNYITFNIYENIKIYFFAEPVLKSVPLNLKNSYCSLNAFVNHGWSLYCCLEWHGKKYLICLGANNRRLIDDKIKHHLYIEALELIIAVLSSKSFAVWDLKDHCLCHIETVQPAFTMEKHEYPRNSK